MSILAGQLEQFAGKVRQAADAGGREIELAGLAFGECDEFAHVFGGNIARDDQHLRHRRHQRDRREILCDVVGYFFHRRVDDERTRADDADRVTVGRRLCDGIGAEHAALAAAVFDHDRLLDQFRHALADHARDDVVGTAGWERHDQLDWLVREILRRGQCRQQQQRQSRQQPAEKSHQCLPTVPRLCACWGRSYRVFKRSGYRFA